MYGCESWTVKKAERWRIDAFELWCWRRLLRVPWTARRSNQSILKEIPWTARRSNQSILKEIGPGISLEGMMLKLKLQYFAIFLAYILYILCVLFFSISWRQFCFLLSLCLWIIYILMTADYLFFSTECPVTHFTCFLLSHFWFDLQIFNFIIMWKQYAFSRNCTLNFEFWTFTGLAKCNAILSHDILTLFTY